MKHRSLFLALMVSCFPALLCAGDGLILGKWHTEENKSVVEIYQCGDRVCGRIIDIKDKVYGPDHERAGQTKVDLHNPEPELREKPIIGLQIMAGFKAASDNRWKSGTIYDPENGKTYKCKLTLSDDGKTLDVRGYIGVPALGRTSVWTRAES